MDELVAKAASSVAKKKHGDKRKRRPRTLMIDDWVYEKARVLAFSKNVSLSSLVEDLLAAYVKTATKAIMKA
jgi:hypothetical protein